MQKLARGTPGAFPPLQQSHDQSQVLAGDVDPIALLHFLAAAQPSSSHTTAIEDQREPAFHPFGPQFESGSGNPG